MNAILRFSALLLAFVGTGANALGQTDIEETRTKIQKWVETRQLISKERAEWRADQEALKASKELLQSKLEALDDELEKLEGQRTQADDKREELTRRKEAMEAFEDAVAARLDTLETRTREAIARLPAPLLEDIKQIADRMPTADAEDKGLLSQRLQNVVLILRQAEKFNRSLTISGDQIDNGATQVKVLYWGLGAGYYVDAERTRAGRLVPGDSGWTQVSDDATAAQVGLLLDIYEDQADAAFVPLPFSTQK